MTFCDAATNVENFLFHPVTVQYNYIPQPSNIGNWYAVLSEDGGLINLRVKSQIVKLCTEFNDADLLMQGQLAIEPLLAEDWNSPEDDIWDTI